MCLGFVIWVLMGIIFMLIANIIHKFNPNVPPYKDSITHIIGAVILGALLGPLTLLWAGNVLWNISRK